MAPLVDDARARRGGCIQNTADAAVNLSDQVRQAKMVTLFSFWDGSEEGSQLPGRAAVEILEMGGLTEGAVSVTAEPDVLSRSNLKRRRAEGE